MVIITACSAFKWSQFQEDKLILIHIQMQGCLISLEKTRVVVEEQTYAHCVLLTKTM